MNKKGNQKNIDWQMDKESYEITVQNWIIDWYNHIYINVFTICSMTKSQTDQINCIMGSNW